MTTAELVKKTANYVRMKLYHEPTGHDWYHVERVLKMARYLQSKEGGDLHLVELAALLHDVGDEKNNEYNMKGALILRGMMEVLDIEEDLQEKILVIINDSQYRGSGTKKPYSLEGQIIQDADFLDLMGAIGIARIFATGGSIGRMIYDPFKKPRHKLSLNDYLHKKTDGTSINYFTEKVLVLPKMLNTDSAKKIAERRIKFLENYLKEFSAEVEGEK